MKFNLVSVIKLSFIDKWFLFLNGLNSDARVSDESTGSLLSGYKSIPFFVNIFISLINIVNVNYLGTVNVTSGNLLITLREVTYILLVAAMKMTITGYNQLVTSTIPSLSSSQKIKITKIRLCLLIVYIIFLNYQTIQLLINFNWSSLADKLINFGSLFLLIHSIWISNGLHFYSTYLYTISVYSVHQLCLSFKDKVIFTMNKSTRPSTHDITTIRSDRFRYQAIKRFLDRTINWWSIVWYFDAFFTTCLILVNCFYPSLPNTESTSTLTNNLLIIYLIRTLSLFGITILVDYITNYETSITFYIGDHLAPRLDDSMEIRLEYV